MKNKVFMSIFLLFVISVNAQNKISITDAINAGNQIGKSVDNSNDKLYKKMDTNS